MSLPPCVPLSVLGRGPSIRMGCWVPGGKLLDNLTKVASLATWVWVESKAPDKTTGLVHVSIYARVPFWVPIFHSQPFSRF